MTARAAISVVAVLAALCLAACGGSTEPQAGGRAVAIVAERTVSDTIGARLDGPLTVEVRDPSTGAPRVGVLGFDGGMRFLPALPRDLVRARISGDEGWVAGITPATAPSNSIASIWRFSSDGTTSTTACDDACDFFTSFVEISNDGQRFIYGDLFRAELVDFVAGRESSLGTATVRPRFAPDGTQFADVTATSGEVHVRNIDLSSDRRVAGGIDAVSFGSIVNWSSDGRWIVASTGSVFFLVSTVNGLVLPLPSIIGGSYVVLDGWRP